LHNLEVPIVFLGAFEDDFLNTEEVLNILKDKFPGVYFKPYNINSIDEAYAFLEAERNAIGYIIFNVRVVHQGVVRALIKSGKPILYIARTMEGSPNYLMDVVEAKKRGYPVLSIATEDVLSDAVLNKVKYLVALSKIRGSKVLIITAKNLINYMSWAFPNATELSKAVAELQRRFGLTVNFMELKDFIDKYYSKVTDAEAEVWVNMWIREASQVVDPSRIDLIKAAKLYLALLRVARERGANVVAYDCIMNVSTGLIDSWPCLGYMQLWYDDLIPVCEADLYSILPLLIGKYLFGRPGYVNDPGVDEINNSFVYWHCYAPTNPHGSNRPEVPYIITDAHGGGKHASIHVKLPVNEPATVMSYNPVTNVLSLHVVKTIDNIYWKQLCATKLVAVGDAKRVAAKWVSENGYHRVLIYGDFREEVKEFAILLGIKVVEEDQ